MSVAIQGPAPLPRPRALTIQLAIVVLVLAAWEFVPQIPAVASLSVVFDRTFVSSPSEIFDRVIVLATGRGISPIWGAIGETVKNAVVGTAIGVVLGMLVGLVLSNWERLSQVLHPLVVASNSMPRIALIPLIVVLVGPNERTAMVAAMLTSFFTVFFNAYEGGRTLPPQVLDNADVLGASPLQLMRYVRFPYVLAWSFAQLPNAVSHGLLAVVTAEVLTGTPGVGRVLTAALVTGSAATTFAIVVYIALVGLILVSITDRVQRRWLHWWVEGRGAA